MTVRKLWPAVLLALAVNGFAETTCDPATEEAAGDADGCPVLSSSDWNAWIDHTPGTGEPTLNVTGVVELPTPGFTFVWREGPLDRRSPPTQRLVLVPESPTGLVAQVLTTETVQYRAHALATDYRSIHIVCGSHTLAIIDEVAAVY